MEHDNYDELGYCPCLDCQQLDLLKPGECVKGYDCSCYKTECRDNCLARVGACPDFKEDEEEEVENDV